MHLLAADMRPSCCTECTSAEHYTHCVLLVSYPAAVVHALWQYPIYEMMRDDVLS